MKGKFAISALLVSVALASPGAFAQGGPPAVEESGSNNLSFPVIMSDNEAPGDFSVSYPALPTFATISSTDECTTGSPPDPLPIPDDRLCYFDGTTVWWLQQRPENKWQAYPPGAVSLVDVTAVDVGDLLESSRTIKAKQIRTEFTLLQDATKDEQFSGGVRFSPDFTENTFQAFNMSGAVPGTDQSINEIQGTDYGPGPGVGLLTGTLAMVDPTTVKLTNEGIPVHATVYSRCARLVIQKITDPSNLTWDSDADAEYGGYWVDGALPPVVDIAAWDDTYSAEINAGGSLIYGFNWNTRLLPADQKSGTFRLTFVLEGGIATGGKCAVPLNTVFATTVPVNLGEVHPATVLTAGELAALAETPGDEGHGEGGAVYVDVELGAGTGGGGGGGGGGGPPSSRDRSIEARSPRR